MSDSDEANWRGKLANGGLPQILAGPAGAAISRLIGAATDIPAAFLESFTQGIKDKKSARSQISQAIAGKVAAVSVEDPAVMQRAIQNMLGRAYRVQANKDAIARIAVESLVDDPVPAESIGPTGSWMMKFERYVEDVSDDDLRMVFGKLLAGEIRRPGEVAQSTLHFVSMLEPENAALLQRVLPHTSDDGAAFLDCITPELTLLEKTIIEQTGFWTTGLSMNLSADQNGVLIRKVRGDIGFAARTNPDEKIMLNAAVLSRAGKDLLKIVGSQFDFQRMANVILARNGKNFYVGVIVAEGTSAEIREPRELYSEP